MGEDHVLNIKFRSKLVMPLIFTDIQRVKVRLCDKSKQCIFHVKVAYLLRHGSSNSGAIKPFGLFHLDYPLYSKYCSAMTIPHKICSWHITQAPTEIP